MLQVKFWFTPIRGISLPKILEKILFRCTGTQIMLLVLVLRKLVKGLWFIQICHITNHTWTCTDSLKIRWNLASHYIRKLYRKNLRGTSTSKESMLCWKEEIKTLSSIKFPRGLVTCFWQYRETKIGILVDVTRHHQAKLTLPNPFQHHLWLVHPIGLQVKQDLKETTQNLEKVDAKFKGHWSML